MIDIAELDLALSKPNQNGAGGTVGLRVAVIKKFWPFLHKMFHWALITSIEKNHSHHLSAMRGINLFQKRAIHMF